LFFVFVAAALIDAGSACAAVAPGFDATQYEQPAPRPATTQSAQTMSGSAGVATATTAVRPDPVPVDADITSQPHPTVRDDAPEWRPQDPASADGTRLEWRGYLGVEGRLFIHPPAFPGQVRHAFALVAQPEVSYASEDRRHRINAMLFGRLSVEPGYGSADVRELYWQYRQDRWSLLAGMNRVFWGATESRHAIDIVNQSDMRENYVGDVKLGQLMVAASLQRAWGQLEFYALPVFRTRAFPVNDDRLRLELPVEDGEVLDGPPFDVAARVSVSRGDGDLHAYYFHGMNREPNLIPVFDGSGAPTALRPIYKQIDQFAADLQYTLGGWLFKGELMHRSTPDTHYQAAVGGLEYGISRLFGGVSDLALLSEYQFDNRPDTEWPAAPAKSGIYAGMRLAVNDTKSSEAKAGVIHDLSSHAWLIKADFTRRLIEQWGLSVAYSGFLNVGSSRALSDFSRDSYFTITLRRYL
jgi:hypothetical protein